MAGGLVFTALLMIASVSDVRWRRIPNALVIALALCGFLFSLSVNPPLRGALLSLGGLGLGFAIWIAFYAIGLLGAGDVKLFAAAGAWLGPGLTWRAALLAALIGGVLAAAVLLRERRLRQGIRVVAMSVSSMSTAPLGRIISETVPVKRHLPYGVALAVGAMLAGWFPQFVAG